MGDAMQTHDGNDGEDDRLLHRLLFFTDAVFAIVLTLLVLELRPPQAQSAAELVRGLAEMIGHFIAFLMSFAVVAVFWLAHMSTVRRLGHFDWPTAIANLVFLLPVCLLPFATSLIGEAKFGEAAWRYYCWNLIATSAAMIALTITLNRGGGRLVGGLTRGERLYRIVRAASPAVAFGVSLAATQAHVMWLAQLSPLLIPLQFVIAERFTRPRPAKSTPETAPSEAA